MTTVAELIESGRATLAAVSPTAPLDVEILLSSALNKNRTWLKTWPEAEVSAESAAQFQKLITRRHQGEPIAYILGEQAFWSLSLLCSPDTLIPRPETELLVEKVLELKAHERQLKVLDLGTGTGAIALALASEKPDWKITGADQSEAALAIAQKNCQRLNLTVEFVHSDWFSAFQGQCFDVVVSNPPYIEYDDPHLSQGDLRFEPKSALVSGADGLDDIRKIAKDALLFLSPGGLLLLEHGYNQGASVRAILCALHYEQVQTVTDLNDHDRITLGYKKH